MNFEQADAKFRALKARFETGDLSEADFKSELQNLMIQDAQGSWWMIGYETERWYRHDGTDWIQTDPPGSASPGPSPIMGTPPSTKTDEKAEYSSDPLQSKKSSDLASSNTNSNKARWPLVMFGFAGVALLLTGGFFVLRYFTANAPEAPVQILKTAIPVSGGSLQTAPSDTPPPSIEPSQTVSPTPEIHLFSAVSRVYFYKGPGLEYGLGVENPEGTEFLVLARSASGLWFLSRDPDGNEGWLYKDWIFSESDLSLVPIASSIPPPPPTATKRKKEPVPPTPAPCYYYCY